MNRPRRPRALSADERRLWAEVARSFTPMPGRALPPEPEAELKPEPRAPLSERPRAAAPPTRKPPALPPLAAIERKLRVALRRGGRDVDAVIDLHGLRQAEAHGALLAFLRRSRDAGHGLVLVVTGKGAGDDGLFDERGVLRRVVPHWLSLPEFRALVLGIDEAGRQHGGAGALYVRLRRRRPGA